jgi:hypothetical protein
MRAVARVRRNRTRKYNEASKHKRKLGRVYFAKKLELDYARWVTLLEDMRASHSKAKSAAVADRERSKN